MISRLQPTPPLQTFSSMSTMQFCPQCENLMVPKENFVVHKLKYQCQHCETVIDAPSNIVYENTIEHTALEKTHVVYAVGDDPTLPRTKTAGFDCDCGNSEFVFFQSTNSGKDQAMTLFFVCTKCNKRHKQSE